MAERRGVGSSFGAGSSFERRSTCCTAVGLPHSIDRVDTLWYGNLVSAGLWHLALWLFVAHGDRCCSDGHRPDQRWCALGLWRSGVTTGRWRQSGRAVASVKSSACRSMIIPGTVLGTSERSWRESNACVRRTSAVRRAKTGKGASWRRRLRCSTTARLLAPKRENGPEYRAVSIVVRKGGLEPPLDCSNKLLRLARLPIPPLPQWPEPKIIAAGSAILSISPEPRPSVWHRSVAVCTLPTM